MDDFIDIELTPAQAETLVPIVATLPRKPVLFVSSVSPLLRGAEILWRWQICRLDWKRAARVLKIIQDE
jgi:hypothetical protein